VKGRLRPWIWCVLILGAGMLIAGSALAESAARIRQLEEMLSHSDFRVRTQAAFSLGRVRDRATVPPLLKTLRDRHPAVRAAAAVALGRIGDARALPGLRSHSDDSEAVRSQVRRAITLIEEGQSARAGPPPPSWSKARHYVELGGLANVSKTKRPGLMKLFRTLALREMRRLPRTVVGETGARPSGLDGRLRRYKVIGYQVTGSIGRLVRYMAPGKVQVRAEVMLAVTSYPGHTYCMTVTGVQAVSQSRRSFRPDQIPELQEEALAGALGQAISRLGGALSSGAATKCHGKAAASRAGRGKRRR